MTTVNGKPRRGIPQRRGAMDSWPVTVQLSQTEKATLTQLVKEKKARYRSGEHPITGEISTGVDNPNPEMYHKDRRAVVTLSCGCQHLFFRPYPEPGEEIGCRSHPSGPQRVVRRRLAGKARNQGKRRQRRSERAGDGSGN